MPSCRTGLVACSPRPPAFRIEVPVAPRPRRTQPEQPRQQQCSQQRMKETRLTRHTLRNPPASCPAGAVSWLERPSVVGLHARGAAAASWMELHPMDGANDFTSGYPDNIAVENSAGTSTGPACGAQRCPRSTAAGCSRGGQRPRARRRRARPPACAPGTVLASGTAQMRDTSGAPPLVASQGHNPCMPATSCTDEAPHRRPHWIRP